MGGFSHGTTRAERKARALRGVDIAMYKSEAKKAAARQVPTDTVDQVWGEGTTAPMNGEITDPIPCTKQKLSFADILRAKKGK